MTQPLITGSLAFDYVMRIGGRFAERLSVPLAAGFSAAFVAPSMRRLFGGCAGNIAYGLRQLGAAPRLMATVGDDFGPYREYLAASGIDGAHVLAISGMFTAQAYIVSDDDESQFIVFHPGAAAEAHRQSVHDLPEAPPLAIVSPNGGAGMLRFCRELAAAQTPFIFDPGQAMGLFNAAELKEMMALCAVAIFNRDEYAVFENITAAPAAAGAGQAVIVTRGEAGSEVFAAGQHVQTMAVKLGAAADTTGCGDAYRAGLIYGMLHEWRWPQILRFASVLAGVKARHMGGQGYCLSADQALAKCKEFFG